MPLDPSTDALLKNLAAQNGPAIHDMDVPTARAVFGQLVQALQGEVEPIHKREDRTIPGPGGAIPVRIYTPRGAGGSPLPVLVLFHGGGWVIGDLDTHDAMCRYFANHADVIVVSVDYRLAPEHRFPAGIDDCVAATAWVYDNAASLGADPKRLAVTGDSAGGNMAAVVAQQLKGKVAFQLLIYPATDFSPTAYPSREKFGTGEYFLSAEDMAWFGAHLSEDPEALLDVKGSPIAADSLAGLAPAVTITAGYDPLVDEGKAYADRLAAAGVPSEYKCFEGTIHGFVSFPGALEAGREGLAYLAAKLKAGLA
ncbi:MAG: alpha/beta hydrolase [Gammaproteobacteria bacterium]